MAAPSSTVWGSIVNGSTSGRKGRIGIYTSVSSTNTETTVNVQVWFWTIYSCSDGYDNALYYNVGTGVTSATTLVKSDIDIDHTVATGEGWNTANQTKLYDWSDTYTRGTSAKTYKVYAKFSGIDMVSGAMSANTSYTVPKLTSYTVTYNANGGSGAPSSQTKWYGTALTLSSTKPTRTGYTFQGWATSATGSKAYSAGGSYTANASVTLYAVWTAKTYTISYNANGGSGAPSSQTKTHGTNLTLSSTKPTRTNYTFKGWATSASATTATYSAGGTYTSNANATLYAVWSLSYTKPSITEVSASRCNSSGTISDSGTNIVVKFKWTTTNTVSSIKIELESSAGTSTTTVSASGTSGSVNKIVGSNGLSTELAYTVRITVADSGGSWTVSRSVAGALFIMDALNGGKGISFGKAAELEGYADFAFKGLHRDHVEFTNMSCIYGTSPTGDKREVINLQNANGNLVLGYDIYNEKVGNTNVYGYDVNLGVSNIAEPGYFRPYRRQGDSVTIKLQTAGFVTNAGKDVHFFIPFTVPIVGSPTVTLVSGNGFILRQDEKYTHGSSASVYAIPSSYTINDRYMFNGLSVKASFTDTTNVINNSPIGIVWHGTITFT